MAKSAAAQVSEIQQQLFPCGVSSELWDHQGWKRPLRSDLILWIRTSLGNGNGLGGVCYPSRVTHCCLEW